MVLEHRRSGSKQKARLTPGQLESWLAREGIQAWGAEACWRERKRLSKLRKRVHRIVCSEPWFDANWHRGEAYPPGGDQTLMVPCRSDTCQGRLYPPQYVGSSGHCTDCRLAAMSKHQLAHLPGTTSSINLARMKAAIRRGEQPRGGI